MCDLRCVGFTELRGGASHHVSYTPCVRTMMSISRNTRYFKYLPIFYIENKVLLNIFFIKRYYLIYLLTYVELPFDPSLQFSSNHHESS